MIFYLIRKGILWLTLSRNLKCDFKKVQRKIGHSKNLVSAEGTKLQREHCKEYYDEESKNIVAELHCKDIETFVYSF